MSYVYARPLGYSLGRKLADSRGNILILLARGAVWGLTVALSVAQSQVDGMQALFLTPDIALT